MNKVTKERIDLLVATSTFHFTKGVGTTTFCQMILQNGFSVSTGESACVDPNNYDFEVGKEFAKQDALKKGVSKLWELEGYALSLKLNPIE